MPTLPKGEPLPLVKKENATLAFLKKWLPRFVVKTRDATGRPTIFIGFKWKF